MRQSYRGVVSCLALSTDSSAGAMFAAFYPFITTMDALVQISFPYRATSIKQTLQFNTHKDLMWWRDMRLKFLLACDHRHDYFQHFVSVDPKAEK